MSGRAASGTLGDMDETPRQDPADTLRSIDLVQIGEHRFKALNGRGGVLPMGNGGDPDFTPVELLLAALAGCGAIELDHIAGRRAPFASFRARSQGHKIRDESGNRLVDLTVSFDLAFPEGEDGDAARAVVSRTLGQIEDRLCSVGRTVSVGEPVRYVEAALADDLDEPVPGPGE